MDGEVEHLTGSLGHGETEDGEAQHCSADEDDALDGICPDDCLQTAQHRVDDDGDRCGDDDHVEVPAHEDVHRHGEQVEDAAHAGYLGEQVTGRGIEARPAAKFLFQEGVGRDTASLSVEWHEIAGGEIAGDGDGEGENKRIPVGGECLAGVADVADARDIGGENAHAHHPSGQ